MKISTMLVSALVALPLTVSVAFAESQNDNRFDRTGFNPYNKEIKVVQLNSNLAQHRALHCPAINSGQNK